MYGENTHRPAASITMMIFQQCHSHSHPLPLVSLYAFFFGAEDAKKMEMGESLLSARGRNSSARAITMHANVSRHAGQRDIRGPLPHIRPTHLLLRVLVFLDACSAHSGEIKKYDAVLVDKGPAAADVTFQGHRHDFILDEGQVDRGRAMVQYSPPCSPCAVWRAQRHSHPPREPLDRARPL